MNRTALVLPLARQRGYRRATRAQYGLNVQDVSRDELDIAASLHLAAGAARSALLAAPPRVLSRELRERAQRIVDLARVTEDARDV